MKGPKNINTLKKNTELIHHSYDSFSHFGFVNPPVYKGSTVLFPDMETLEKNSQKYDYGRNGSPTMDAFTKSILCLEGGYGCKITPSGLSAITTSLLAFLSPGDHILVTDSAYQPTRYFCDNFLYNIGIETTYYDPLISFDIKTLFKENTKLVVTESPGSQTMEVQDIPAISELAKERDIIVVIDNTWATPLFFDSFKHGVDVSIQSATKYIVGHSDVLLGTITTNKDLWSRLAKTHKMLGVSTGPDDMYLGLRGVKTLSMRLSQHQKSAIQIAKWLQTRPEVEKVLYPALPEDKGYDLWSRDFTGSTGLFSIILNSNDKKATAAMLDELQFFGMGYSWGGYESLILPFFPQEYRTATRWPYKGQALRLHIGLESPDDLIVDLERGFYRLNKVLA